jgi:hypothetical protein
VNKKYTIKTIAKKTTEYYLAYEIELDHYPTVDDLVEYIPSDEEYIDDYIEQEIYEVEME